KRQGLTGAAVWYDYVTSEADRLTFAWAMAAVENGAVLANHVRASAPLTDGRRVVGVRARDVAGARDLDVAARITVNATGAAVDRFLAPLNVSTGIKLLKAMNLVTRREAGEEALGAAAASGRHLFLVPWRGHALFGTWESDREAAADDTSASEREVAAFVAELNGAFPSLDLKRDDVLLVHRGVVPAVKTGDRVLLQGHEQVRDHATDGGEGIV